MGNMDRRHFHMHFLNESEMPVDNKLALIQAMAWPQIGIKSSVPVVTKFH